MSKANSINLGGPVRTSPTGQSGSGSEVLDRFMPASDAKIAAKTPARQHSAAPVKRQSVHRNQQAQRGNRPVKQGYDAKPLGASTPMLNSPQKTPNARPPQTSNQLPARSPYNVTVTDISERTVTSSNNGLKVSISRSFPLNRDSKLNTAISVQGNTGSNVSNGRSTATRSTVIGASAELERKFPTADAKTSITAKAKIGGEISQAIPRSSVKGELGVSVTANTQLDKTTSAYLSVGGKTVISSISTPATTLSAQVGLDKVLTADGKLKLNLNAGVDQQLGGNAEIYAGGKLTYKVDKSTSIVGEIRVTKDKTEIRGGIGIEI
jgi:hypothetical protein